MKRKGTRTIIAAFLAVSLAMLSTWPVSAHEAHPTSGDPHAPAHNEDRSPGFTYSGWVAPYTGYFSIYEQGGIPQIRFTVTLSRLGGGSGGGSYQATWYPNTSGLNRFDTPIRIIAGEKYNITVYEQEVEGNHSGWYEGEGWLPPRVVNLDGSDVECGVGNHPFNSIMVAMGGSARFLSWNVFSIYNAILNDMTSRNPSMGKDNVTAFIIKPPSVSWGNNSLGVQCWGDNTQFDGDWVYHGTAYSDDIDFEDFTMVWAYNPTNVSVPTVQVQINSASTDYGANELAGYVVSWKSSNVTSCSGSGSLAGKTQLNGQVTISRQPAGTYEYTMTCSNGATSVKDTRKATIYALPAVSVTVDNSHGPPPYSAPAGYTVRWSGSKGAVSCSGQDGLAGRSGLSGSLNLSGMNAGTYTYTMTCNNGHGASATDKVIVTILDPPTVDVKVNGQDGPLTLPSPAAYMVSWNSTHASSCQAKDDLSGTIGVNGEQNYSNVSPGTYSYTVSCTNGVRTVQDSAQVQVVDPLRGTISAAYAKLVLYSSEVDQSAQTLSGTVRGGETPYSIVVHVRAPSGQVTNYSRKGATWNISPEDTGDPDFGTTELGTWIAWAEVKDQLGQNYQTGSVTWEVDWYPVHGLP